MDYFEEVLEDVGITITSDSSPNVLCEPQPIIINKLEDKFKNDDDPEVKKNRFLQGLKALFESEDMYTKAFSPSVYKKIINDDSSNISQINIPQDSIVQILLKTSLQTSIIHLILEDITNIIVEDQENTNKLRLLLNTLMYLPFIENPATLTTQLLDLLDIATMPAQFEILYLLPEILPDSENNVIGKELSKLLVGNENLAGAIIDCLNALNLSPAIRCEVQQEIKNNLITSARSIDIFPLLFEFLVTDARPESIQGVLHKVRGTLENMFYNVEEAVSMKVIIVRKIKTMADISRVVHDGWLSLISSINVNSEHKSVDLLILFLLHAGKKQVVESLFKRRVKAKLFKMQLVAHCFEKYLYADVLKDSLASIMDIGQALLMSKNDPLSVEFATQMYKCAFQSKNAGFLHRQAILQNLLALTHLANNQGNLSCVLRVFTELLDDKALLKKHTLKLMELLEKLDMFDLRDAKTVFEILCSVTYSDRDDESSSGIQNEMHMLIRKHVACWKMAIKHRGVACAIVTAKHMASTELDQSEVEVSSESLLSAEHLPAEGAREAAKLLQLTYMSTANLPALKGLYFDELAAMLIFAPNLDKHFLAWLFENITNDFQELFVVDSVPDSPVDGISLSSQFCINSLDETDAPISVNIAGLTLQKASSESGQIEVLAPLFRALRLLHYAQNAGDLSSIDALLGCGVVLPRIECIDNFSIAQLRKVTDCVFHAVNWFREVVSAFVSQKIKPIRQKVLKRLNHVIELEKLLQKCMEYIPEHRPPLSYFHNAAQQPHKLSSPKKAESKQRKRPRLNETEASETTVSQITQAQAATTATKKSAKREKIYVELREIDTETILLLKYPLGGNTVEETPTQQSNLNLQQFNFLIRDFTRKLHTRFKGKPNGPLNLHMIEPKSLIVDSAKLLPIICRHLRTIKNSLNMILDEADQNLAMKELYSDEAQELKVGFGTIIEMFSLVYGWSGFHKNENYDLMVSCLKGSLDAASSDSQLVSTNTLIKQFLKKLSEYEKYCLHLQSAVFLIETMNELYCINMNPEDKKVIDETSARLVARRWYNINGDVDTGRLAFLALDVLIKTYLDSRTTQQLYDFVVKLKDEAAQLQSKKDNLRLLPCVDKPSFHILFRGVCHALLERLKVEIQAIANNQHLVLWKTVLKTLQELIDITKIQGSKSNFLSFFKKSNAIFKIFVAQGIPIFEIMLKSNPTEVVEILKTAQVTTRFLQHLCCHSKVTKDAALIKYVPQCKCTLETIIYRVKAVLVANGCTSSFWMGNLKNKDLSGEIISSQSTSNSDMNSEEHLSDDDSDEELFGEDNDNDSLI